MAKIVKCTVYEICFLLDIIGRVRNGETPPYRPTIPKLASSSMADDVVDMRLVDLMQQCWLEDPHIRPQLSTVLSKCQEINEGKSVCYVPLWPFDAE